MKETDQEPRILVVEDEVLLRWFLRDILEDAGFNVEERRFDAISNRTIAVACPD
jgi:DNA-binding response OmpR family regulator